MSSTSDAPTRAARRAAEASGGKESRSGNSARGGSIEASAGRVKKRISTRVASAVALIIAVLWTIPTFGLFASSFREPDLIEKTGWWTMLTNPGLSLKNYQEVLLSASSSSPQLGEYFFNSLFIAIPATLFPLALAAMAAYAFAWIKFKGSGTLFVLVFALQIVPLQLALIPLLQMTVKFLHPFMSAVSDAVPIIADQQYLPVWIAHTIFGLPLAIFLLHNFISEIPREVIEAARVDGAGHGQIFLKVVLPLALPALASVGIFQFLWVWNDLLVALVFSSGTPDTAPLTQRLAELAGSRGQSWARLTAGAFVSLVVPLLVFFGLQRFFVRGLLAGSAKG